MKKHNLTLDRLPQRLTAFCCACAAVIALTLFGYVALYSLTQTSVLDPENFGGEVILYQTDGPFFSLLLTGVYIALALFLRRFSPPATPLYEHILTAVVALYAAVCGFCWIFLTQSVPAADSGTLYDTAREIIAGDWTSFHTSDNDFYGNISYYQFYPFQLGYVFLSEMVYRLCGGDTAMPMQVVNVLALAALYAGLLALARRLFRNRWTTTLLAVLLMGCLQPIFFCAFAYGNLPGFAAGVWGGYFAVRFMQTDSRRWIWLLPTAGLLVLAVVAKYNNMIWVLAVVIGLTLDTLHRRQWRWLPAAVVILLLPMVAQRTIIYSYEVRSGVDLGSGISQLLYLRDGLEESKMAPGWYNDEAKSLFVSCNGDTEKAQEQAADAIRQRLEELAEDPAYTVDFFRKKLLSQWNEPSYESLWVSQVKGHYNNALQPDTLLDSIYNGSWNTCLHTWFNLYQSAVLLLFCGGVFMLLRRGMNPALTTLLAVPLGGALYHQLFEGKSQYCLTYFIMLVFFAAHGLGCLSAKKPSADTTSVKEEALCVNQAT